MAKRASILLMVKNGPAELSFLPSKPLAIGCDLSKITNMTHQVACSAQEICWEPNSLV